MAKEIIFLVEEAPEGGYAARAWGHSIFTEADSWDDLKGMVQEAVRCHFEERGPAFFACIKFTKRLWLYSIAL